MKIGELRKIIDPVGPGIRGERQISGDSAQCQSEVSKSSCSTLSPINEELNRMTKVSTTPRFSGMKYRVVNTLGTGAGSTILLISDKTAGGKRYALKVVRKQEPEDEIYVQQALTEFEAAKKLNHPAIAKIFDCRLKKAWFKVKGVELLMEYVDGKTLDEIEAPELGQLVLIFCQVASALTHMHRRGVYHGDLKPGNIMLTKNGQVKLIDFGTAWVRGQEKNRIQGTPAVHRAGAGHREGGRREDRHLQPGRHDVPHVHRSVCPAGHPQAGRRPEAGAAHQESTRASPRRSTS